MKDFNSYRQEENKEEEKDVSDLAERLTAAFAGKGEGDVLRAIYAEAEKSRKAGTLTDAELDRFYAVLSPMLGGAQRKKLAAVLARLKKM